MFETARAALYPVLPLRDIVVFPHMIVPLFVGREKSVRALEDVMKDDKQILHHILDRKSTRLNSSHGYISYAVFCLKKKTNSNEIHFLSPGHCSWFHVHGFSVTP